MKHTRYYKLGVVQKHILQKMVFDDYYILKTFDNQTLETSIDLVDDHGNYEMKIPHKTLLSFIDRSFVEQKDVSQCLELQQTKFYVPEHEVGMLINFIC